MRPELVTKKNDSISITDDFSLHSALKNLVNVFEDNDLVIIHGLGYREPIDHTLNRLLFGKLVEMVHQVKVSWLTEDTEDEGRSRLRRSWDKSGRCMGVFTSDGIWLSMTSANQFLQPSENQFVLSKKTKNHLLIYF